MDTERCSWESLGLSTRSIRYFLMAVKKRDVSSLSPLIHSGKWFWFIHGPFQVKTTGLSVREVELFISRCSPKKKLETSFPWEGPCPKRPAFFANVQVLCCGYKPYPIESMYAIFTYTYQKFKPNVGKSTIHTWILQGGIGVSLPSLPSHRSQPHSR